MIMVLTKMINIENEKITVEKMRVQFIKTLIHAPESLICDLS